MLLSDVFPDRNDKNVIMNILRHRLQIMSLLVSSWSGPHESHNGLYTDKERNNDPEY